MFVMAEAARTNGRPRQFVDRQQLEFLRSMHFTWEDIANLLGVSVKTLQRRAKEWGIKTFSVISDCDLDHAVSEYLCESPFSGEAMINGHLRSGNVHVQRSRIRSSMLRIRSMSGNSPHPAIVRRTYSVPGPNALWHMDGNHKMIRWRLVVHGCIDGFSRVITFLQCSNNNHSDTVLDLFIRATSEYGTPSRVRTDRGGENVQVWQLMEEVRGRDRGSYIAGSSVHNTRIERLWRDVYTAVTSMYVSVFSELEERNLLDPDNETDLFCLHYVFLPRVNASLNQFGSSWNNHPLSTENNLSPIQLYTGSSIGSNLFLDQSDMLMFGVESDYTSSYQDSDSQVIVPNTHIPLSQQSVHVLQSRINPLQSSSDYGIDLYLQCSSLVFQLMQDDNLIN